MLFPDEMLKLRRQMQHAIRPIGHGRMRAIDPKMVAERELNQAIKRSKCCIGRYSRWSGPFAEYICTRCGRGQGKP